MANKAGLRKNSKYQDGRFMPINKNKYTGDIFDIIYRSSYELKFFRELDRDEKVIRWISEPKDKQIKYYCSTKNKQRTYIPDVYCEKVINGKLIKILIEIKPESKLVPPRKPKIQNAISMRKYGLRVQEYINIQDKKKYAEMYCKLNGFVYIFITEKTINNLV